MLMVIGAAVLSLPLFVFLPKLMQPAMNDYADATFIIFHLLAISRKTDRDQNKKTVSRINLRRSK